MRARGRLGRWRTPGKRLAMKDVGRSLTGFVVSAASLGVLMICSPLSSASAEETYVAKSQEDIEILSLVLASEVRASNWTKNEVICFSIDGLDPSPQLVKALRQRGLRMRSSAEWSKKFNCGFEVQLEHAQSSSVEGVKVRSRVVDLREINRGEGDLALLQRAGEYSLRKVHGKWSIAQYIAKMPAPH